MYVASRFWSALSETTKVRRLRKIKEASQDISRKQMPTSPRLAEYQDLHDRECNADVI
jgi:hypothetical protein